MILHRVPRSLDELSPNVRLLRSNRPATRDCSPLNTGFSCAGDHTGPWYTPPIKGDFVNRKELVAAVADEASLEQKTVDAVLRALQTTLEGAVAKADKVSVPGFFALSVGHRAAREGRNPATGADDHDRRCEHGQVLGRQRAQGSRQQVSPNSQRGPARALRGPALVVLSRTQQSRCGEARCRGDDGADDAAVDDAGADDAAADDAPDWPGTDEAELTGSARLGRRRCLLLRRCRRSRGRLRRRVLAADATAASSPATVSVLSRTPLTRTTGTWV